MMKDINDELEAALRVRFKIPLWWSKQRVDAATQNTLGRAIVEFKIAWRDMWRELKGGWL